MRHISFYKLDYVALLIVTTPFLMVLSRNIASPIFAIVALVMVSIAIRNNEQKALRRALRSMVRSTFSVVCLALLAYMGISSAWSSVFGRGLEAAIYIACIFGLFSISIAALKLQSERNALDRRIYSIAIALAAVLVLIELTLGSPIRTFFGGSGEPFRVNRAAVAAVLFLPLVLSFFSGGFFGLGAKIAIATIVGVTVFCSESESAKLAFCILVLSIPVFGIVGRAGIWIAGAPVLLSFVAMPFLAPYVMDFLPHFITERLDYSTLGLRAEIWAAHASLIQEAPIFGHGLEASYVSADDFAHKDMSSQYLGWAHPHNFSIQVWYELGLVGVVLVSTLIVFFFRSLKNVPKRMLPSVLSSVLAVWAISMVSHGAWQAWWWCLLALLSLLWLMEILPASNSTNSRPECEDHY